MKQFFSPFFMRKFLFQPPFLEFKNGAVRLNFGGYHAEAGLGGLLGGGRAGGGLHVSAGTPEGSHASAGLGGLLGDNGSAGINYKNKFLIIIIYNIDITYKS